MMDIEGDLRLPEHLREELREPFGRLVDSSGLVSFLKNDFGKGKKLIAVGDLVSLLLIKNGIEPSLIIWDGISKREAIGPEDRGLLESFAPFSTVVNPAATISKAAWDSIQAALQAKKASIYVNGEEDLLAIPAAMHAPDGSAVIYGLPDRGIVLILVERNIRASFGALLDQFQKTR